MNKRALAKLLFQHKDIKSLFESRQFDASTLRKVISEEIMREGENESNRQGTFVDADDATFAANQDEMKELKISLEVAKDNFKAFQGGYLEAKASFTQAKVDGANPTSQKKAMAKAKTFKKEEQERIDKIEAQIAYLKSLGVTASKTQTPDDDEYVDMAVDAVAQNIKDATDMIDAAKNEAELAGISRDVATSNSGELETAQKAVQAAVAKDKESPSRLRRVEDEYPKEEEGYDSQVITQLEVLEDYPEDLEGIITGLRSDNPTKSIKTIVHDYYEMYTEAGHVEKILKAVEEKSKAASPESPEEETDDASVQPAPQTPAGKGWKNAKSAARVKVTDTTTIEQIRTSLESADAFKKFWGVKGEVDTKMAQAKGLFDSKYFNQRIEELKAKATDEGKKEEVAEEAANLAATVMGYSEFLNNMMAQQPNFKPPEMDFPQAIPTTEEEFKKEFIEPIAPEGAKVGTSPQDYIALGKQVIQQAGDLLKDFENNQVVERFLGWYVGGLSTNTLEESVADVGVELVYAQKINEYDKVGEITKVIKSDPQKWNNIFTKLDELVKTGQIKINKSDEPVEDEDPKLLTQQVIENTPEVEPDADAELGLVATEEMDAAWTTTLNAFFGKDPTRSSFMRQFLLKNQASMLYGMIGVLEQIITGGAGNEERAYTGEKTQVRQKEEPVVPPAEAEKKKETPKTDTSADDEGKAEDQKGSLEEQVINEIFGMFGGKDNEDKEIKFSPKSTKLMRQDLEAMVDLLRSLKTDISQYKKYSTSSSVDPRFDGSTLKRAMDAKLKVVQQSIAHLTKVIDLEVQSQADQLKADGAQTGQNSVDLQEASGSDRKVRIAEVEKVYNEMRRQYLKGLQVSLSTNDAEKAKAGAKELKDYVMGQETFMSYFPSNIITSSGGVMTLGGAHKSMVDIIAPFIETIRDIVTITKTQKVSESNLQQAIGNLVMISDAIESMFKVPSLIDREFMKKYIEAAKQNPENQPLTDEEPGMMDRMKDLAGKGLEKLKQMFSWMSEEALKLLAKLIDAPDLARDPMFIKFVEPFGELVIKQGGELTAKSEGSPEVKQVEELMVKTLESKSWFDSLKPEQQSAVTEMINVLYTKRNLLQEMEMGIVPSEVKDKISHDYQMAMVLALKGMSDDQKQVITSLMQSDADDFVSYLVNQHELRRKMGEEKTKAIGELTLKTSGPLSPKGTDSASADVEFDDEDDEEGGNIDLPDKTNHGMTDPSDVDRSEDPFGDVTNNQEPEEKRDVPTTNSLTPVSLLRAIKIISPLATKNLLSTPKVALGEDIRNARGFLAIAVINSILKKTKTTEKPSEEDQLGAELSESKARTGFIASLTTSGFKDDEMIGSIKSFMVDVAKLPPETKLRKMYEDTLKILEKVGPQNLVRFLNKLIENAKEYKEKGGQYLNAGNVTKIAAEISNESRANLEESLRPIIEKMLNEHYNH